MCRITSFDIFSIADSYINQFIYFIDINFFKVSFQDSLSAKKNYKKIYNSNDDTAKTHKSKTIETLNDDQLKLRQIIDQAGT